MSRILHFTKLNELKNLIATDQAILVDVYAEWCGPCKVFSPKFDELSQCNQNIHFVKVNFDKGNEITEEYDISSIPTIIGIYNQEIIEKITGFDEERIKNLVDKLSSLAGGYPVFYVEDDTNDSAPQMMQGGTVPMINGENNSMIQGGTDPKVYTEKSNKFTSEEYVQGENLNHVYLEVNLNNVPQFQNLHVKVMTRDQGWATVEGSSSYFDVKVLNKNRQVLATKSRIIENYEQGEFVEKNHTININDHVLGPYLKGDNILQLVVRSEYGGWQNYVKYGEMIFE